MDRALTSLGTLAAALAIGFGVVHADVRAAPPAGLADAFAPFARAIAARPLPPNAAAAWDASASAEFLSFRTLSYYEYQPGLANLSAALPRLDGTRVAMRGFMLPSAETEDVRAFVLVASHMSCCFGVPAGMNGQVYVELKGGRGLPYTNEPVEVRGTFRARERSDRGYVLSIFEIENAEARIVPD